MIRFLIASLLLVALVDPLAGQERRRIPTHTPEWTNPSDADPGLAPGSTAIVLLIEPPAGEEVSEVQVRGWDPKTKVRGKIHSSGALVLEGDQLVVLHNFRATRATPQRRLVAPGAPRARVEAAPGDKAAANLAVRAAPTTLGDPIPGADVVLEDARGGGSSTATTDDSGEFWFTDLKPGNYVVRWGEDGQGLAIAVREVGAEPVPLLIDIEGDDDEASLRGEVGSGWLRMAKEGPRTPSRVVPSQQKVLILAPAAESADDPSRRVTLSNPASGLDVTLERITFETGDPGALRVEGATEPTSADGEFWFEDLVPGTYALRWQIGDREVRLPITLRSIAIKEERVK